MISVVIPLYNKEKSITTTLESVLTQSYTDYEVIVVDDGSTDNSANIVRELVNGKWKSVNDKIRLISKPNGGVCSARNRGIKEAKGEYVALLDGDDMWDKEFLAEIAKMIEDFPKAAMWGANYEETLNGKLVRRLRTGLPEGYRGYVDNYFHMQGRQSDLFCSSSVVIRKEAFAKVGMFDERLKYAEDNDMWFRIIATYPVAFYDQYLAFYRYEAENRAMMRRREMKSFLPYYVDKFKEPIFRENKDFYQWINQWCAQWIARYLFADETQRADIYDAAEKLDYSVIPFKYRLYFKMPYWFGEMVYRMVLKIKG